MAATPAATTTTMTIHTAVWRSPEASGTWKDPAAKNIETTNSSPLATQPAVVAIAPELSAVAAS